MKKLIALFCALVLAMPAASLFTSCGEKPAEKLPSSSDAEETAGGEEEAEEDDGIMRSPTLPKDLDISGRTFNLWIGSVGIELYAEEDSPDMIDSIVYERNSRIEENYGVELNIVKSGLGRDGTSQQQATEQIQTLIMSGDKTYNAFTHVQHTGMPQMILDGSFVDWNELPYVDLSQPWWYENITNDLCFGNKVYVMTGDYAMYIKSIDCLLFNKNLFDELELEYPYEAVKNGTWTWDQFTELALAGSKDLDGDGLMRFDTDRFGLTGWAYETAYAFLIGQGYRTLEKDADNMPILNQNIDYAVELYDRIVNFTKDPGIHIEFSDYGAQNNAFAEGRTLFKELFLSEIATFRDTDFDFGILPLPKYDENADYHSRSSNMTTMTYIPVTCEDLELTSAVLEELAYESYLELTPAYFDTVLTVKNTRDVESEEMLPIIRDSARFLYDGFMPSITQNIQTGNNTYASTYAAKLDEYLTNLESMREQLLKRE